MKTQSIWFREYSLTEINSIFARYMTEFLSIKATEITDNTIVASMPVNERVFQPFKILHGGASVVLAESIGSVASNLIVDPDKLVGVGMEINANHLKSVAGGTVYAHCTAIHIGKKSHVWDIRIKNDQDELICISRLTVAIIDKK
ncbi:hotdog fold thioesterase [Sphingobacterium sp. MYb382]|uniref:hotdog fold thioesterase n=1 Tax=Sphingobacterium sp. MYb382 TaxID=2745278 RepID=UPI003098C469